MLDYSSALLLLIEAIFKKTSSFKKFALNNDQREICITQRKLNLLSHLPNKKYIFSTMHKIFPLEKKEEANNIFWMNILEW